MLITLINICAFQDLDFDLLPEEYWVRYFLMYFEENSINTKLFDF